MADSVISQFVSRGTTAERTAYTPVPPSPAAGPDPGYVWWDTDTQTEWAYDFGLNDWVELAGSGSGTVDTVSVGFTIDGGGAAIPPGLFTGLVRRVTQAGTIVRWTVSADQAATVEFDVFLDDPTGTYPPTTSIVASAPPELTTADFDDDTTLTGWTTAVSAGDMFAFELVANDVAERLTLQIDMTVP